MAKREFHSVEDMGGPHLLTLGGEVQQAGVIVAGEGMQESNVYHEKLPAGAFGMDMASDKFAVLTHTVDNKMPYQILPVEYSRKRAQLLVPSGQAGFQAQTLSVNLGSMPVGQEINTTLAAIPGWPAGMPGIVNNVQATLVTDATAVNRTPSLVLGGIRYTVSITVAASNSAQINWAQNGPTGGTQTTAICAPIGTIVLQPTQAIATSTRNLDPGDQWMNVIVTATTVPGTPTVLLGSMSTVDACLSGLQLGFPLSANIAYPFEYTSKQPLYACSTTPVPVVLSTMVERFQGGTPAT